ncbi:hypothetical protein GHT07_06215 [Caenimonas koreensis DSM 17982]|uniref:Uncharacterized protein n=1 Tax=Caenimonas koreensis DSM 17982 TaxID=1121255 RepID=A0A844B0P7_9BURK|nr:hypothetical protein [Caenimonas koreensis]MRD46862.1 hypothetical protein [Caenimonas koreensis DSM 17982]
MSPSASAKSAAFLAPTTTPDGAADIDSLAVAASFDGWDDVVEELGAIKPSHRSRKSQVADFLLRRKTSDLPAGALVAASRAHQSRFFREALTRKGSDTQGRDGQPHGSDREGALTELVSAVKSGKGAPDASFELAKKFASARPQDVAQLLSQLDGGQALQDDLRSALVRSGMGGTKARKCTEVIYAALVAQFATGMECSRLQRYAKEIDALEGGGGTFGRRLQALNTIESELAAESGLSTASIAMLLTRLTELRSLLEQSASQHELFIVAAIDGITVDSAAPDIEGRLRELDERDLSIASSSNLDSDTRLRLQAQANAARATLEALRTRSADLDAMAAQPRLRQALHSLDVAGYVNARASLANVASRVAADFRTALFERLDEIITGTREVQWLQAMCDRDAEIIDMVLPGAQWDDLAWSLKSDALDPAQKQVLLNLEAQHLRRKAARALDIAMQSAALSGARGANRFPTGAFQALRADATLIAWFVQNAPRMVGERDLAIANWIRLSVDDTAQSDALFLELQAKGIDIGSMQDHARQGFQSSADVQACMNQIQAFGQALQKNSLVASLDPQVRVAQVGMQLLANLGISAADINDPAIDVQARPLIEEALHRRTGAKELLRALRRIAVVQVANESQDANFTPAGQRADGVTYSSLIIQRLAAMGQDMNVNSANPVVKEAAVHLREKLPADTRSLDKLCADFDPASLANRAGGFLRSPASIAKPSSRPAAQAKAAAAQRGRQQANEAMLKQALAALKPGQVITISFGAAGEISVSVPTVPGLSVDTSLSAEKRRSIAVSLAQDGTFDVEILAGASARHGASVTTLMDAIDIRMGVTRARDQGYRVKFDQQAACEALLVAVANNADIAPHVQAATAVESAAHSLVRGDVSVTATADLTIASLSLELAAAAGESHSVHEGGQFKREVFSRDVRAQAVLRAALAGDLASREAGVGIDLGVRRTIVRENGMLAGGPQRAELSPTLSLVTRVAFGNQRSCLDTLLPGDSPQKQAIAAELGSLDDGAELFMRYGLSEAARAQANGLLGKAQNALTQAAQQHASAQKALRNQARNFAKEADAVMRNPANYTPQGFGWTQRTIASAEKSRGVVTQSAQRASEQTVFRPFDELPGGAPQVGRPLLLAAMAA